MSEGKEPGLQEYAITLVVLKHLQGRYRRQFERSGGTGTLEYIRHLGDVIRDVERRMEPEGR